VDVGKGRRSAAAGESSSAGDHRRERLERALRERVMVAVSRAAAPARAWAIRAGIPADTCQLSQARRKASAVYQAIIADQEIAYKPGPSISPQLAPADALPSSPSVRARQANRATE